MTEVLPQRPDTTVAEPKTSVEPKTQRTSWAIQFQKEQAAAQKTIDKARGLEPIPSITTDPRPATRPLQEPPLRRGHPPQHDERFGTKPSSPTSEAPEQFISPPPTRLVGRTETIGRDDPTVRTLRADSLHPQTDTPDGDIDLGTFAMKRPERKEETPVLQRVTERIQNLRDKLTILALDPATSRRILAVAAVAMITAAALNGPPEGTDAVLSAIPDIPISLPLDPEIAKYSPTLEEYVSYKLSMAGGYSGEQVLPHLLADVTTTLNDGANLQYGQEGYQVLDKTSFQILLDLYSNPDSYYTGEGEYKDLLTFEGYKTEGDKQQTTEQILDFLQKYRNLLEQHPDSYAIGTTAHNTQVIVPHEGELSGMILPTPPVEPQTAAVTTDTSSTAQALAAASLAATTLASEMNSKQTTNDDKAKDQK